MVQDKRKDEQTVQLEGLEEIDLELTIDDLIEFFFQSFNSQEIHIESIELERDTDRYVYEIEGWDEEYRYELKVNAKDLRLIAQEKKENAEAREILDLSDMIPPKEAMMKAIEASGGGPVEEWELEKEQNQLIYAIDISEGEDQKINAVTGELLKKKLDSNDENKDEEDKS